MNKKLITLLENEFGMNYFDIIKLVIKSNVKITENDIKIHMYKKLVEETLKNKSNDSVLDESAVFNKRYSFNPYTLYYFKNTIKILQNKSFKLLEIIYKLANNDINSIKDTLIDLDITLDTHGKLNSYDLNRLLTPTIYNIKKLVSYANEANNLDTYLTFKISLDDIYSKNLEEKDIYPTTDLQYKSFTFLENVDKDGYISMTKNQYDNLNFLDAVKRVR